MYEERFFICLGVAALLCIIVSLPLAVIALVLAQRAAREVKELSSRLSDLSRGVRPAGPGTPAVSPTPAAPTPRPQAPTTPAPARAPLEPVLPWGHAAAGAGMSGVSESPAAAVAGPTAPPAPPRAPAAPAPAGKPIRWEELIGQKVLAWVGVIVVIFGAGFFIKYGYDQGWFGRLPWMRVVVPSIFGILLLAGGERFSRKGYRVLARVMTGGGLMAMYSAAFVAWAPLKQPLISDLTAWVLMSAVTGVAVLLAVRYASLTVAIFSLVGGLALPLLVRPERDPGHALFLYLIAVNAGVLALAYFKKWRVLNLLALAGTIINVITWLYSHYYYHDATATEKLPMIVAYMTILWAVFFAVSIVYHTLGRRDPSNLDLPLTLVNVVAYFAGLYVLLREPAYHYMLGPAAAILGAAYLGQGLALRRWAPAEVRFTLLQVAQALGLLTLAIPIQLSGVFIPMAWAVEATVLFWLGLRLADWRLRGVALLVHAASVVALLYYFKEAWSAGGAAVFNARTATIAAVALAMAVSAWLYRRQADADRKPVEGVVTTIAAGIAHVLLMVLIMVEAYRWHETARGGLDSLHLEITEWQQQFLALLWTRDMIVILGLAVYGLMAVGLVTLLRRGFHHAMALVAFAGCAAFLVAGQGDLPALKFVAAWNPVGAAFAGVAACLAMAAVLSQYFTGGVIPRPGRGLATGLRARAMAVTYELLAVGTVLGLYLTELSRANDYVGTLGYELLDQSMPSLAAAGFACVGGIVALRGLWIKSFAHRAAGLAAMAVAVMILASYTCKPGGEAYETILWQPRGVAYVLLIAAMALVAAGYARQMPRASGERRYVWPVLAVLVHLVVLACFSLEAMDFWSAHAERWFPNEAAHAWYARQATLSVGYALYAFLLLAVGIARRSALLRIMALALLGATLAKVMLLDLSRIEAVWRILSFLGLGLLLLAASFLYYKYRHIIFKPETDKADGAASGAPKEDSDGTA